MSEVYLGQITMFAFNFAPQGFALCNGQLLPINQNQALFSLLGTNYGGNGIQTFGLPNLQGNVPLHMGSSFQLGQIGGEANHSLATSEMPNHLHAFSASAHAATSATPAGTAPAEGSATVGSAYAAGAATTALAPTLTMGSNQAHSNMQPYLVINFVIALQGIFPSRN
jgi:microcystin-dependent protein